MKCVKCKAEIEDDSWFCDQCGIEIKRCSVCSAPGKGKRCTKCGNKMVPAQELAEVQETNNTQAGGTTVNAGPKAGDASVDEVPKASAEPDPDKTIRPGEQAATAEPASTKTQTLTLINKVLNISLKGEHEAIIGRKKGQYAPILGQYGQVSGTHAQLHHHPENGWTVTDLGSTNGTKYNKSPVQPHVPQKLENKSFLQIANIEFYVEIS